MLFVEIGSRPFCHIDMRWLKSSILTVSLLAIPPNLLAASENSDDFGSRQGQLALSLRAGFQVPMGSAERGASQSEFASFGPGFGGELSYGLSRYVMTGIFGDWSTFAAPKHCSDCSAQSLAFGLAAQYHLIEGTPFDPFIGFGVGWRMSSFDEPSSEASYAGPFGRILVAGDWYPHQAFGFGPFLDLSVGRYVSRDPGEIRKGAVHSFFTTGLRVTVVPFR